MRIIYQISRVFNKLKRVYRDRVFYERTGQKASLVGDIVLINTNLKIGKNVCIYPYVQFFGDGLIEIGDNVDIGTGTIIYSSKKGGVSIGNNTLIAAQCYIIDHDHGIKAGIIVREQDNIVDSIKIGNDVWIAANVTVLKGSIIENGAIVGAKSLIKGKVPKNSIVVGIPSKIINYRSKL